ncbi:TPA: hypothetical protein QDZ42_001006 [Stenotrophomonas maltophilia]|nr:hypothetical protein [Stenotrophomonas maltophilia]HDS1042382.1 hypothetical protein [Stenotrophomonas maltophilia]
MEDIESMTARQMLDRRMSAEQEASRLIGQIVFAFSRFVQSLHLCVAWHDEGKRLSYYPEIAGDLMAAKLIRLIVDQARLRFGEGTDRYMKYGAWSERADRVRIERNIIMHSTWSIEAYGRHAIAVSTPVLVEPAEVHIYTMERLAGIITECGAVSSELSRLRHHYPL